MLIRGLLAFLLWFVAQAGATSAVEKQLQERRNALRKLERELREQREQVASLESEEKGVLNTISIIDQNLNQTRDYLEELGRNEKGLEASISVLHVEVKALDASILAQQKAMRQRVRELYMKGRTRQWEELYRLLRGTEDPNRQVYLVRRLLEDDQERVERLRSDLAERNRRQQRLAGRLNELQEVRVSKAREEEGLQTQLSRQNQTLEQLKQDKEMQKRALAEYVRNQKTMMAIINALETKRKKELAAAKRRKAEQAREAVKRKKRTGVAKAEKQREEPAARVAIEETSEVPVAIGPKCPPLRGEVISAYGYHEHKVLHTMTRNLGTEIRGKRGEPVRAAAAGTVVMVTRIDGRGPSVIVDHGNALYTVYGHMASIRVREGQEVRHCQDIGDVGDAESLNGFKLYFQVSQGTHTLDPMVWLRSSP